MMDDRSVIVMMIVTTTTIDNHRSKRCIDLLDFELFPRLVLSFVDVFLAFAFFTVVIRKGPSFARHNEASSHCVEK